LHIFPVIVENKMQFNCSTSNRDLGKQRDYFSCFYFLDLFPDWWLSLELDT